MAEQSSADFRGTLGRYALYGEIAAGGMATVHLARLLGPVGFARTVAIKRLHPHLAKDPDFVGMFLEEARLAARVRHPNVVHTLDVVSEDGELFLVMEYVAGESLSRLVRKTREANGQIDPRYVVSMVCGALDGLHAAHEATSERGTPLGIVHRDVSPQNIHIGIDGVARVLDFGIAKATNRVQETRTDQIKGKVAYMSPEQLAKGAIDRRADVYSAAVVLWEALTGHRLFKADDVPTLVYSIINDELRRPSDVAPHLPKQLDDIVMKGLEREADKRWPTALAMAEALEKALSPTPPREIGSWVKETGGDALAWRVDLVHRIESETSTSIPPPMRIDSPAMPIEASSGVVANAPSNISLSDAVTEVPHPHAADEDHETLVRSSREPPLPTAYDDDDEHHGRSRLSITLIVLAFLLLAGGGAFFAVRFIQVASDQAQLPVPEPSASVSPPEHEPAIGIGIAKTNPAARGTATSSSTSTAPPPTASTNTPSPTATGPGPAVRPWQPTPPAPVPAPRPTTPKPDADCDNPFTIDSRGIRHPKPHCFKR